MSQLIIFRGYNIKANVYPLLNILKIKQARIEYYFYKKNIKLPAMKENRQTNSVDLPVFYTHVSSNSCGVLITFFGKNKICVNSGITEKHGRILIGSEYILVNIYNANTDSERLKFLNDRRELIEKVNITQGKEIILAGGYNLFSDSNLEAMGGKPILNKILLQEWLS